MNSGKFDPNGVIRHSTSFSGSTPLDIIALQLFNNLCKLNTRCYDIRIGGKKFLPRSQTVQILFS
jgi:hypothetical protein